MKKNLTVVMFLMMALMMALAFASPVVAQEINPWAGAKWTSVNPESMAAAQAATNVTLADYYPTSTAALATQITDLHTQMDAAAKGEKKYCEIDKKTRQEKCVPMEQKLAEVNEKVQQTSRAAHRQGGGFSKAQRAEIEAIARVAQSATDVAIIAVDGNKPADAQASAEACGSLVSRAEMLERDVATLKLQVADNSAQLTEQETAITDLKSAVEALQNSRAVKNDPELSAVITDLDARSSSGDQQLTDQLVSLAKRVVVLEDSRARGLDKAKRNAEADKVVKEAVADINKKLDRVEDVAYKALTKATVASAKADETLRKIDGLERPLRFELSGAGIFSKEIIAGVPVGLGFIYQSNWFRVAGRIEVGLYKDDGFTAVWDSQVAFYYAWKYGWVGLFGGTYGIGQPFQDEFGYTAGFIGRLTMPIKDTGWSCGLEGWIGPAYEYKFVKADPPTGNQIQVYDEYERKGALVPAGGVRLVFNR